MPIVHFNPLLSQNHVFLKVVFYIDFLLLASTQFRLHQGRLGDWSFSSASLSLASFLVLAPEYAS